MRPRHVLSIWLLGLALVTGGMALSPPAAAQSQKPIKIGFLSPLTGGAAQIGRDMVNGFQMYLDENGNQLVGRKVEVIVEDTQGQPAVALTKLRKLVESDKVDLVAGEAFAHIGYALAPKADEYKIPMIFPVIAGDDLTQRKPARWLVRLGWTSSQPSHPFGEWVAKNLGYKRVVTLGTDYAFGWEVVGGFQRRSRKRAVRWSRSSGRRSAPPTWRRISRRFGATPTPSSSSWSRPAPCASPAVRRRRAEGALPVIGGAVVYDESVLREFGDEALGAITPLMYSAALETPQMKRFVSAYRAKYGKVPSYFSETCYTTGRWIHEAAKVVGGQVEDREKFLAAMRKVEIPDAPRGPLKLDAWAIRPEHLHPKSRAEGRGAGEHGNSHVSRRLAVLEVRAGGVPEATRVQPKLPALQVLLGAGPC